LLALLATAPGGEAPMRRGVNLTNWFRYPPSGDGNALASYISDDSMAALRRTGFDFVRLAVQPPVIRDSRIDILVAAIRRLQRQRLAVIVGPHFGGDAQPAGLLPFWQRLAPRLAPLDPRLTVPAGRRCSVRRLALSAPACRAGAFC
jgi:endoglucanase